MKAKLEAAFIGNPEIAALLSGINLADIGWKAIDLKTALKSFDCTGWKACATKLFIIYG